MSGRKLKDSNQLREWVRGALQAGAEAPAAVMDYINKVRPADFEPPTRATINRIMYEMGLEPGETVWQPKKGKKS